MAHVEDDRLAEMTTWATKLEAFVFASKAYAYFTVNAQSNRTWQKRRQMWPPMEFHRCCRQTYLSTREPDAQDDSHTVHHYALVCMLRFLVICCELQLRALQVQVLDSNQWINQSINQAANQQSITGAREHASTRTIDVVLRMC